MPCNINSLLFWFIVTVFQNGPAELKDTSAVEPNLAELSENFDFNDDFSKSSETLEGGEKFKIYTKYLIKIWFSTSSTR